MGSSAHPHAPRSRWWILFPIALMISMQIVSGLPHPAAIIEVPAASLGLRAELLELSEVEAGRLVHLLLNGLHLPAFVCLALAWCWSLASWRPQATRRLKVAALICFPFAVLNELSQVAVPQRLASVADGAANTVGVAIGLALYLFVDRWSKKVDA